jgi:hypothetical protein
VRRVLAELAPDTIEHIARRVAEILGHGEVAVRTRSELIDARELARRTGLSRAWIYEHARQLGAIKLGDGPRPRLRFDPQTVNEALRRSTEPPDTSAQPVSDRRGRPRRDELPDVELLPIRSRVDRVRRLLSRNGVRRRIKH